jgi:hypothetical protein
MIEIELGQRGEHLCECCGGVSVVLTRFVYQDGDAFAVYYAGFSESHSQREVKLAVGMGEWGEDSTPAGRRSFALRLRDGGANFEVSVMDAEDSPWRNARTIGKMLDREEALADTGLADVFHITDHIATDDPDVREYLLPKTAG